MARGDLTVFEEAKATMLDGGWEAADEIWIGLVTDVCVVSDANPHYAAGGTTNYMVEEVQRQANGVFSVTLGRYPAQLFFYEKYGIILL